MRRALVLALCLWPLTAAAQDDDRGFLTRFLEENLSGDGRQVRFEGFSGALSSRAQVAELTVSDETGVWLRLTDVTLDWNRSALLSGRVEVTSLTAAEIVLDRLPPPGPDANLPSPEAVPFSLPDLPVSVKIGQLSAASIRLGAAVLGQPVEATLEGSADLAGGEGSAALVLDRRDAGGALRLTGGFVNATRRLQLDLSLQEPPGGIAAGLLGLPGTPSLALNIAGDGPIEDFEAVVSLATEGQDRLFGSVRVSSTTDGARGFRADLKGDVAPLFLPEYQAFFGPEVALLAEGQRAASGAMDLSVLRIESAALQVQGTARIASDGIPQRFDLALDLGAARGARVLLPLPGDPVRVASARLRMAFDAAGGGDGWRLIGSVIGLDTAALAADRLALEGSGRIARQPGGQRMIGGTLGFDGEGLVPADPAMAQVLGDALAGTARFHWIDGAPLALTQLELAGTGYGLTASAQVTGPVTALTVNGTVEAEMEDLGRLTVLAGRPLGGSGRVGWTGAVSPLSGVFDGVATVQGRNVTVNQAEVDALLAGNSVIRLDAARGPEGTQLRALDVVARTLHLQGQGWVRSSGPDLVLDLDFADLSVLGDGRAGQLVAQAKVQGTSLTDDLSLGLKGTGTDLRLGVAELDGLLRGETTLDVATRFAGGLLRLDRAELAGPTWQVATQGTLGDITRELTARLRFDDLRLAGPRYRGVLTGNVAYTLEDGRETATLSARTEGLAIGNPQADSLLRGTTGLVASASREAGVIRIEGLRLDNPQLSARADASQTGDDRRLDITARLADLAALVPGVPGPLTLSGRVDERAGRVTLDLAAQGPGNISARVGGTAAVDFSTAALRVDGTADAALANAFLGPVALRGPLRFDLAMNGQPSLAALSGTISLSGGRLTLANPPFAFSGVEITAALAAGRAQLSVQAASDAGGRVTVAGPVALTAPYSGDLAVTLDALALRDPRLYETRANGRLMVSGPLTGGARISGRVDLGDTELRIPSSGLGGIAAIPDLRHVGEPAAVRQTRARAGLLGNGAGGRSGGAARAYPLDVIVSAPNRVFIRGRGLDAELGGDFRISGTTANVVPSGGLQLIRGRLDLLGRRFAFTEGSLQMEGSLVPTIRLVATTDTVDGSASVIVDGPADAPSIRFESSPELPEEEVVARLLFGRGLTTLTPLQAAQLASAVATLTGKGGSGVVDRLRKSFGLDDFDVSASESGAAAVRAGKYLSENIYVDLTLGSDGKSEVSINLDLSPSVTVRGRAGGDGGTGVGIHFVRDY
ncbi:MAG: translocation/assembly module TamB domain-containing protein [Gemmobacter sp.]|nr:translocation/assembly module TamB domain-containing protein [Gemmobacter sp.]